MPTQWAAIGLSHDLPTGTVMPARWNDMGLAIWRSAQGHLNAWKDRCPHRGMRLSHGFVRGETLNCIYHGWVYGTGGGCIRIPAHPDLVPPAAIRADAFGCREAFGVIWVGPDGDDVQLPDLAGLTAVRSMPFDCDLSALAAGLNGFSVARPGQFDGNVSIDGATARLCLVTQETAPGKTMVHALSDMKTGNVAVSRWLEALRFRVEAKVAA